MYTNLTWNPEGGMMTRRSIGKTRIASATNIYHIFVRGIGRQLIFEDDEDKQKYLSLLGHYSTKLAVDIFAFVLMDNHAHLLIGAKLEVISNFMQCLQTAYASYFNDRHNRVGHLFQGRFGSQGIEDENHMMMAVRYIHLNPVKAGISDSVDYPWSSYGEYLECAHICKTSFIKRLFGNRQSFISFHEMPVDNVFIDMPTKDHRYLRCNDDMAKEIAERELGKEWRSALLSHGKGFRDDSLRKLKTQGLSIRQIERLTGIGRGIIQRA